MRNLITVGPLAGRKTMTLHLASAVAVKALTAARDGFSFLKSYRHIGEIQHKLYAFVAASIIGKVQIASSGFGPDCIA